MISLNEQQNRAVNAPNRPLLVIAGAGTGKTRVLIERIIKLLNEDKIDHRRILVITFTNKARDEIKARIEGRVGQGLTPVNIYTFHAFFHKLLLKDIEKLDPNMRNFKLLDENDQRAIVRRIIKEFNLFEVDVRAAVSLVSLLKINDNDLEDEDYIEQLAERGSMSSKKLQEIYRAYQKELRDNNYFDYDDLEVFALKALKQPEIAGFWKAWFQAILIDEFQDTSTIQMEIVKQLADKDSNIFCVGDPDQSIYGFRGAKPNVCSEFQDYFGADNIKLEENYRSTKHILELSNHLINKDRKDDRLRKHLRPVRSGTAHIVKCIKFDSDWDEVEWVLNEIDRIRSIDKSAKLRDFVILYRNNILSKPFEIAINKRKWDCEVTNSVEFFSRLEIKFIVAFLRVLYFHEEAGVSIYLGTIFESMSVGIGEASCDKFFAFIGENGYTFMEGLENVENCPGISSKVKKGFINVREVLKSLNPVKDTLPLVKIIDQIVTDIGYAEYAEAKKEMGRLENIRQFATSISSGLGSNKDIVEEISLRSKDVKRSKSDDFLLLSTVHQAKGLEYKYVFVVKMTDDIFPSRRSKTPEGLEEERRLAYVAFTRAKDRLYITSSPDSSKYYQSSKSYKESVFVREIRDLYDHVDFSWKRRTRYSY